MDTKIRVVVTEDDPVILADLVGVLRRGGFDVVAQCATANDMIAAVIDRSPDVVVFDVHLPDGDGLHAFRLVRSQHPCAGVPVTGDRSAETASRAIGDGVYSYVIKPVVPEHLVATVRMAATQNRKIQALLAENAAFASARDDPRGLVVRAKAQLTGEKFDLTPAGAHKRLLRIAHKARCSIVRAAELFLDGVYTVDEFCNYHPDRDPNATARPSGGRAERQRLALSDG